MRTATPPFPTSFPSSSSFFSFFLHIVLLPYVQHGKMKDAPYTYVYKTTSETVHDIGVCIEIIVFTLVADWCKIIENTYANLSKAHIVPQLLTLLIAELLYRLAFDKHLAFGEEVHEMTMLDGMSMEVDGEVKFPLVGNIPFLQRNLQCILVHILIEIWPQVAMHCLAATIQVIAELLQLLIEVRVYLFELFDMIGHRRKYMILYI